MNTTALLLATAAALADGPVQDPAATAPAALSAQRPQSSKALIAKPDSLLAAAAEVHPWWNGAVYHLATAPERVSDIALQPGETLIAVAAGDTARWVIGDTTSGSGPMRRIHILVKPAASGLRTNLVITTDRRVYHLELASGGKVMTSIAWTYPQDELLALHRQQSALASVEPVAGPVAVERLNFNYAIDGDAPVWRPIRAFDDGAQVFIEFPPALDSSEAPPLFVVGASGKVELVNYRKRGRYYVVDRLFGVAELRLGGKRQQVVRITRSDGRRQSKRAGRAS
ncbi:MAG: P-type conjugative transfer protein TrbG [Pseudomonadota bacterium]|nr:P-type conjugative transfer protein TrbG [Pseudomonadota bacterium]